MRTTKAEREALAAAIHLYEPTGGGWANDGGGAKTLEALKSLQVKLTAPKKEKGPPGLGWSALRDILSSHLGSRLAMPPAPDQRWYGMMNGRIKSVGLDAAGAEEIAVYLKTFRRRVIDFGFVVNNITSLLASARGTGGRTVGGDGSDGRDPGWLGTGLGPSPFDE